MTKRMVTRAVTVDDVMALCADIHGNGLNGNPWVDEVKDRIRVRWVYDCMDAVGYYRRSWAFTLYIPRNDPDNFTIRGCVGNPRAAYAQGVKDYLEDVVAEGMRRVFGSEVI